MNSLNSSQKINDIIFLFKTIEENKHNLNVFSDDDIRKKIKASFETYIEDFKNLSGKTLKSTFLPDLMSIIHENNITHDYLSMNANLETKNIHKYIKNNKI